MTWQPELWSSHATNVAEADEAEERARKAESRGIFGRLFGG